MSLCPVAWGDRSWSQAGQILDPPASYSNFATAINVTPINRQMFRKSAVVSGLATEDQVRAALEEIVRGSNGAVKTIASVSDNQLADKLIEQGVLTPYQADQLRSGRTKLTLGPYIINDWIGQGGMGQVFKAVHDMLGRESAVKVLPLNKANPDSVSNFRREIRTQAQLDHPNLVRAFDAGEDGNVHYLVVEFVPGTDLRRLVRAQGKLSIQQASNVIMQAAKGLDYAHSRGLIHRDVKPGNILVTPDGVAKVSDLGLAGFIHDAENDPRKGKIVGTADYLAPEQIRNPNEITSVSDIYALGCTLYYAITGKVPYPGGSAKNKARRHLEETPWHPRRFNEEVSDEFVDLIADMMEKDPAMRVQSAAEVVARLEPWALDASPLSAEQMLRSRWMPAPLPMSKDSSVMGADQDTGSGAFDFEEAVREDSSASEEGSQGTLGVSNAGHETRRISDESPPPPPMSTNELGGTKSKLNLLTFAIAGLCIGLPLAFLVGGAIGFLIGKSIGN